MSSDVVPNSHPRKTNAALQQMVALRMPPTAAAFHCQDQSKPEQPFVAAGWKRRFVKPRLRLPDWSVGVLRMLIRTVLGAAALIFSVTGASSGLPKQPVGNWLVNFDDAQCIAQRNFRTEKDPLYLVLKQPPIGDSMQVSIIEKRPAVMAATELEGTIEFDGQPPHKVRVLRFGSLKSKLRVLMTNLPVEQFSSAFTASALRFRTSGFDGAFALTEVESLLKVMNDCVADLRQIWNVRGPE
jgi:hypothetical protein